MEHQYTRGEELTEGLKVVSSICNRENYALYQMEGDKYAILVSPGLMHVWVKHGFLTEKVKDDLFSSVGEALCYITESGYKLFSPVYGPYPETMDEADAFALAFRQFAEKNTSFKEYPNLLYIEKYGWLLPLISRDEKGQSGARLIGEWLTDGLPIDASDVKKVGLFCDWISEEQLVQIIHDAGILPESEKFPQHVAAKEKTEEVGKKYETSFQLPGREKLSQIFNDQIIDFFRRKAEYQKMGITTVPAFLLYGPPGSGKTYAVQQLAAYLKLPVFEINSASVASPYIHDTSKKISEIFQKAMDKAPSVLIIDEIEAYVGQRTGGVESFRIEEVDEFLRNIPLAIEKQVIIFGMTNHLDLIDNAILRKGRFDQIIEVGMPSKEEILAVLKHQLERLPVSDDVNLDRLASRLLNHPLSDVAFVVREAGRRAVRSDSPVITDAIIQSVADGIVGDKEETDHHTIGF